MNKNIKTTAIITAGGNSTRFGSNKLTKKLKNLTVIETTVSKFIDLVDEIVIPTQNETKEIILNSKIYSNKIKFAPAGDTRQESVYNAILACSNPEIVLIHDGARPFIEKETIKEIIKLTKKEKAVIAGIMAIDTIKQVKNGKIIKTLDRKTIFQAQTPQAFNYKLIKLVHEKYKNDKNFTDDSSMVEKYGIEPVIFETSPKNKKITTKEDLI